jgi:shikimate dehydrogenase
LSAAGTVSAGRLGVVGQPVSHSLSPRMQTAAFEALGIADRWTYEAIELSPEGFADGIRTLVEEGFRGVNVTVPHKVAALAVADEASAAASGIGAANTLSFDAGRIRADNTDAPGLIASLPADPKGRRALVLGAGGSARAVVWALAGAGAEVSVWNRTAARARDLVAELGGNALDPDGDLPLDRFDLIVNCTSVGLHPPGAPGVGPAGLQGEELKTLGIAADQLLDRHVVVDLVYGASPTELCKVAGDRGAKVVGGLEMLVHQGAESLRIWTGLEPPIEAMRKAVDAGPDDPRTRQTPTPEAGSGPRADGGRPS